MKMEKKILIVFMILLIVACKKDNGLEYPITDKDFKKGTDGLVFDFLPNGPPMKVFEETQFEIAADMWNKGAHDVTEGYITAIVEEPYMCILTSGGSCADTSDIDAGTKQRLKELRDERTKLLVDKDKVQNQPDSPENQQKIEEIDNRLTEIDRQIQETESSLQMVSQDYTKDLLVDLEPMDEYKGKSVNNPEGTSKFVQFTAKSKPLDLLSVQHTSPVILTACYAYTTEWTEDLCIDPDVTGLNEVDKACEVKDISLSDQGAPLAIIRIETKILPQNEAAAPQFIIHISNKGKGKVVNVDKVKHACSAAKLDVKDWNRVVLSEFRFSNEKYKYVYGAEDNNIECTPNPLRLIDGEDFIRCTFKQDTEKIPKETPAYTTQGYMKFDYGYVQSVSKNVVIEKVR